MKEDGVGVSGKGGWHQDKSQEEVMYGVEWGEREGRRGGV